MSQAEALSRILTSPELSVEQRERMRYSVRAILYRIGIHQRIETLLLFHAKHEQWTLPGGEVEDHEYYEEIPSVPSKDGLRVFSPNDDEALARELVEELGIPQDMALLILQNRTLPVSFIEYPWPLHKDKPKTRQLDNVRAIDISDIDLEIKTSPDEMLQHEWFNPLNIPRDLPMFPNTAQALKRFKEMIYAGMVLQ